MPHHLKAALLVLTTLVIWIAWTEYSKHATVKEPVAIREEPSRERIILKGVRFDDVRFGRRNAAGEVPVTLTVTNTTSKDIEGMQVEFIASDSTGRMGPFRLPLIGEESRWAIRAGETRVITDSISGYGRRDMSSTKPVDVILLGEDVEAIANRPERERREIFAAVARCEQEADRAAAEKYPDDYIFSRPSSEAGLELLKERQSMVNLLMEPCDPQAMADFDISDEDLSLISVEGALKSWPPLGMN